MELRSLVSSLEYLVSNRRQILLGGIRLGGSTTLVRSQTYYPKHILAYGSGNARYALVVGSGSFRTD